MKPIFILMLIAVFSLGCARVRVEAPKEPIKVDISMRLDIYQHVQKDIDAIEDIVSGGKQESKPSDKKGLLDYIISYAYAQSNLNPEVEEAALRRKTRHAELISWLERGIIGESISGLLEIRNLQALNSSLQQLVKSENADRMIIYQALAKKNNTSLEEIQRIYAERLQKDAPAGSPIEIMNTSTGSYEWKIK